MKFEKRYLNGPLKEYLERCKPHRIESIYNTEYKYIKEIIWDTEAQEKFGDDRSGYEKFKNDSNYPGNISYSGEIDLRIRTAKDGTILGYLTEKKMTRNDSYLIIQKNLEDAKEKTIEILQVKDIKNFDYWLEGKMYSSSGANEMISSIEVLESIITTYAYDEDFKSYLDKIIK